MARFTVSDVEYRSEPGAFGTREGWRALVTESGHRYYASKLAGETDWAVDSHFAPNGFPHFVNGFGARYLRLSRFSDPAIPAALDRAVLAASEPEMAR